MIATLDKELKGYAMLFSGALDVIDHAARGTMRIDEWDYVENVLTGTSEKVKDWDGVRKAYLNRSPAGVEVVSSMLDELKQDLKPPRSRTRKGYWSDVEGDLDSDRAMSGEGEFFRAHKRLESRGPGRVALLCNLDAHAGDTPEKVFWRGAAAIASCDLLEAAGYSCEVWVWCLGGGVFKAPYGGQLSAYPVKQAGDPVDVANMVNSLSSWFLRYAIFGSFSGCGLPYKSIGGTCYKLGAWKKHLDVTQGVRTAVMPPALTREDALAVAKRLLEEVQHVQLEV